MQKTHLELPRHIAIIMDGNGRWAKKRGLPRIMGHTQGIKSVKEIVTACSDLGVEVLTLYAFSTENWKRPKLEINMLMKLLDKFLRKELDNLTKNNVRLNVIGGIDELPRNVASLLKSVMAKTQNNSKLLLNLALNYSSRAEITDAVRSIAVKISTNKLKADEIDEEAVANHLYTRDIPDPDLLIRTSGEMRISNFLLWQISYSEIYVTDKYWPDFTREDLKKAIKEYQKRERRFGGITKKAKKGD